MFRDLHEIRQAFRNSSGCYLSYVYRLVGGLGIAFSISHFRTISEIFVVIVLAIFFFAHNDIIGFLHPLFDCDVHGLPYQCVVPNTKYYLSGELKLKLSLYFQIFLCGSFNVTFYTS